MLDKLKNAFAKLAMIPQILMTIVAIEQTLPIPNVGTQKLQLLIDLIDSVYQGEQALQTLPWPEIVATITSVATKFVAFAKAVGYFKSATPTTPAA
jgi:hypothetical protein